MFFSLVYSIVTKCGTLPARVSDDDEPCFIYGTRVSIGHVAYFHIQKISRLVFLLLLFYSLLSRCLSTDAGRLLCTGVICDAMSVYQSILFFVRFGFFYSDEQSSRI